MKILLSITIPAITLFVAGAWNLHHSQESCTTSKADVPSVALHTTVEEQKPQMWTQTTTLYKGETLELNFSAPNAPFLGVVDPTGHFFYVVFPAEAAIGKIKPLVGSEAFASLSSLKIHTRSFAADPYVYGVYQNKKVFTQSGKYTFITGENLHVDDPASVDKVVIQYQHSTRPTTDIAFN